MSHTAMPDQGISTTIRLGLFAAVAVPALYFGAQLAAAPFYPGYSFLTNSASMLGSDRSTLPAVLNTGALLTGIAALMAAYGLFRSLSAVGARSIWSWLVALSVVSTGAASLWASAFHLPDPRHNPGALGAGMFAGPVLFLLALWPVQQAKGLKIYLVLNLLIFALLIPVMAGFAGINLAHYGGLLQRFAAAVLYIPIGVVGHSLLRRTKQSNPSFDRNQPAGGLDG
ncbi:MAG TPA: DUF998 domain-containing protein [Holophagaceae bacterium]|jgi:hypothetical protein|nr:DUF998 domain-containing protein [Holophagaceae bacterium]